jgi:hypothetical protein
MNRGHFANLIRDHDVAGILSSPYGVTLIAALADTNMVRTTLGDDAPPSRTQPLESVPIGTSPLLGGDPSWV